MIRVLLWVLLLAVACISCGGGSPVPPGGSGEFRITTAAFPQGSVGAQYSFAAQAAGGSKPYTWSALGLPKGLAMSPSGVVSGTPTQKGTVTVTLMAKDSTP